MLYTEAQIKSINTNSSAKNGETYHQDNGLVWVGTYTKKLRLVSAGTQLPVGATTEVTLLEVNNELIDQNAELNTQTGILNSIASKDFATSAKQDLLLTELQLKAKLTDIQPVSIESSTLPNGGSTEVKQAISNLNEYTQLELLSLMYEELQLINKTLKKIYQ